MESGARMKEVFDCTMTFENGKGKKYVEEIVLSTTIDVARAIMSFKPKRGYRLIAFTTDLRPILC